MRILFMNTILGVLVSTGVKAATEPNGLLGVVNKNDDSVSFVKTDTGQTETVRVGYRPHEIVMGVKFAFVSNYGSAHIRSSDLKNNPGSTITKIQLQNAFRKSDIDLGSRCAPHGMVLSKDEKTLYVTCEGRHEIAVVNVDIDGVSHFLPTNQVGSHMMVLAPNESHLYVANFWIGTVSVIDLKTRQLSQQISVGRGCEGIDISSDGQWLFVSRVEDGEILKINTQTYQTGLTQKFETGTSPIRVVTLPNQQLLVNDSRNGLMLLLQQQDLTLIRKIKVGTQPIGLTAFKDQYGFSANMKDKTVSMVRLSDGIVIKEFPTGNAPDGIALQRE